MFLVMVENPRTMLHPATIAPCPPTRIQALDADGKTRSGVLEADAATSAARSQLRASSSWCPCSVQELSGHAQLDGTTVQPQ